MGEDPPLTQGWKSMETQKKMNPFQPIFSKTQPDPIRLLLEPVFIHPLQTQQATQPIKPVSTQPISRPSCLHRRSHLCFPGVFLIRRYSWLIVSCM
jgi:hypothetical protein